MSFDLGPFHRIFFDETEEHLAALERLLVASDPAAPHPDEIGEIFRVAHSIKGGSATFGFDEMAGLTHALEDLLDGVRRGELEWGREAVDACLAARDVLADLLAALRAGGEADRDRVGAARTRLEAAARGAGAAGHAPAAAPRTVWELRFVLSRLVAGSAVLLEHMLEELAALGEVELVDRPDGPAAPWCLHVATAQSAARLRAAAELVAEPGSLTVEPRGDAPEAGAVEEAEDGSYGFFVPVPAARTAPPTAEAAPAPPPDAEVSLRVSAHKVDQLVDLVGELVIARSALEQAASGDPRLAERLADGLAQLERGTRELQAAAMSIRMVPVATVFARFPRMVRELAERLGKRVALRLEGEHTELDRGLVERLADPLTHLVRNALDHGIEPPAVRRAAGKAETATLVLGARHDGGHVVIEVSDDGGGLDRERILARAGALGLAPGPATSDAELWPLVFEPGFSTAADVTELSGRGVGMDVVRRAIAALGGQVGIRSRPGAGTTVTARLPLTLAIVEGLVVAVGDERYVVPLDFVVESLAADAVVRRNVGGCAGTIEVRGDYLPLVDLAEVLDAPPASEHAPGAVIVIAQAGGVRAGLRVDAVAGQQQVVIKRLDANFRAVSGFSAATVLGDGRVALILDVAALVGRVHRPRAGAGLGAACAAPLQKAARRP